MPNPSAAQANEWLRTISREYLQDDGWRDASQRFPGLINAAQAFAKEHFSENLEQQEAFFDGIAIALCALGHFADFEQVSVLLRQETVAHEVPLAQLPATITRKTPEATA